MDVEVFERHVRRSLLPDSFSDHHATLLKICFRAAVTPYSSSVSMMMEPLPVAELLPADLKRMYDMVLLEFASALAKEMMGSDETRPTAPDPHIYDVFLMETTMDRPTKHIAVCVPVRKRRDLAWYNGGDDLIPLSALSPKWRVASLSGSARVLQYLAEPPCLLSKMAMQRSMLVGALEQEHAEPTLSRLMIERGSDDDDNWRQRIQTLNESQRQALATVISPSFQQGFFAIQGPPGCGKTSVLVAMIASIGTGILVVAPSNAAVANIARKVHETGRFRLDEMSVYGENADPTVHFFHPRIRGDKFAEVALQWEVAAENNAPKQEQLRRGMMAWLQLTDDDDDNDDDAANDEKEGDFCFTMAHMRELCPHFNMGSRGGRSSLAAHLGKSKVVFATLNAAGSPMLTNSLRGSVHTLMLDEGGQTAEADFFIATHFPGVKKIVVVGDPMQLPATVIDPDCKRAGFGVSWLSKVHQLFPEKVHLLDTQYRMDPGILLFPNRTFYQNRILSGDNVHSREPYVEYPFLFINTSRRGSEEKNAFSFQNVYESVAIQALLFRDTDIQRLVNESRSGVRIIVISPYRAQVKLLKGFLSCPRNCTLDIATVDSFQGQEGDIVILSTVRTQNIGFADDMQRLNVAITRAKRILRVVGDSNFFCSLPMGSTLRNLCEFARHMAYSQESQVRREAWSRPNWSEPTLWKPVANVRFHECLKGMPVRDRNVCYNTLHAVTTPDIIALGSRIPVRNHPAGNTSYLKGHGEYPRIVWIAKTGSDRPVIEAHFAGSRAECNRFVQMHGSYTPPEAEAVKADLSGIVMVHKEPRSVAEDALLLNQPFASWPVTNSSQSAICDGEELPLGAVQLDGHQEAVARSTPPLIIESRSGTGKTLVLLQHAAYHADTSDDRAACFVTVSPRLRRQLLQTYRKMNEAANLSLPPTNFYSLEELLNGLLEQSGAGECFKSMDKCRFLGFVQSRNSYEQSRVEPHMVENEVGGVICGSIDAALQCAPLSREQYLTTIRSNIDNKTERGCKERHLVYDDYERYAAWKNENGKFDVSDAVLRLLKEPWKVVFSAGKTDAGRWLLLTFDISNPR